MKFLLLSNIVLSGELERLAGDYRKWRSGRPDLTGHGVSSHPDFLGFSNRAAAARLQQAPDEPWPEALREIVDLDPGMFGG